MSTFANAVLDAPSRSVDADLRIPSSTQDAIRKARRLDATAWTGTRANGHAGLAVAKGGEPAPSHALAVLDAPLWIEVSSVPREGAAWNAEAIPAHARFGALLEPQGDGGAITLHMFAPDGPFMTPYRARWAVRDGVGFVTKVPVAADFRNDANVKAYGDLTLGKVLAVLQRLDYGVLEARPARDMSSENAKRAKRGRAPLVSCEKVVAAPTVEGEKTEVGAFLMVDRDGGAATARPILEMPEATRRAAAAMSMEIVAGVRAERGPALPFEEALAIGLLVHGRTTKSGFADAIDICLPELARLTGSTVGIAVLEHGRVSFEKVDADPEKAQAAFNERMSVENGFEASSIN